jgi:hypothetical protein
MDFFKKIGKEVSVFGLVFVVFIALFAYRQVTHVELSTISQDKLEEKIKDIDVAYKVTNKIYEGLSATVFNVNDKLFIQLTNHGMKENRIVEAESAQDAIALVKEHMNFDISESVKYLIDEENRKEVEKEKVVSAIDEKINFLQESLAKVNQFEKENGESESITEAKKILESEIAAQEDLKKKL